MTSRPGWRPEDWLDGYGPLDPDGRFIEAQRSGWEAASSIMARFAETWSAAVTGTAGPDPSPTTGPRTGADDSAVDPDPDADPFRSDPFQSVRAEAARSLDAVMDITRRLVESSFDLADAAMRRAPTSAHLAGNDGAAAPLELQADPGGSARSAVWLHHQGPPVGPITLCAMGPSAAGSNDVAGVVSFAPAAIDHLDDGDSVEIEISISVPPDTRAGIHHGLVLADGLPDVALPLRLVVGSGEPG